MSVIARARGVTKSYGSTRAVDNVSFDIEAGRIVGLIGPNGAGKTTLLKTILGLTDCRGELRVLGLDPFRQRKQLMKDICFVADVAVLPHWIYVTDLLDFVEAVHPNFSRPRAEEFLARTRVRREARVKQLSKGMITQLHLSLIMAIDAKLLVLDEPTLGLDILFRKEFYTSILNDYFDEQRTIIVTTHQVEEIEHILTDVMFIDDGRLVVDDTVDNLAARYVELTTSGDNAAEALTLQPIAQRDAFGRKILTFEGVDRDRLAGLGELKTPGLADLFVAKLRGARA
jgi:ABC-2 type transport system ATP-binding protein